ncbi:Alpha/Beta hydrolase protein [Mycena sanguinolenta]|nr:Alpha/Beta hydrolase protein [Mycena sanguinolenta]
MFPQASRLTVLAIGAIALAGAPTAVDTAHNVSYVGLRTVNGTVEKFLNIRYGAAERFANPELAVAAQGSVVNASAEGPVCPQVASYGSVYNSNATWFSEDCLRLKVARPAGVKRGDKLPVMVFIYGGGLWNGNINERTNEPDGLILQSVANGLPVVYVAMNYRLNVFGFALNDALNATDSLNVGLKDQRLALKWVQQNIEYFGGDPDQVTIFGQSSGALSVTLQILAYGGTQPSPFNGALIESTALEANMTSTLTRDVFTDVAVLAGCAENGDAQSAATIACMRNLTMDELWNATLTNYNTLSASTDGDIWLPNVDGTFIPAAPSELVRTGNFTKMPAVVGWTRNDATLFTPGTIATDADTRDFVGSYYPFLNSTDFEMLMDLYPVSDFAANTTANRSAEFYRSAEIFRDILFTCPSFYFGHAMATKYYNDTSLANSSIPVYLYEQNQTILDGFLDASDAPGLGVIHTSELAYVFGNFTLYEFSWAADVIMPSAADYALLRQQSRSWSTFATLGRPTSASKDTLQGWKPSYAVGDGMMDAEIYVVGGPEPGMSALEGSEANLDVAAQRLRERCEFLNREDIVKALEY